MPFYFSNLILQFASLLRKMILSIDNKAYRRWLSDYVEHAVILDSRLYWYRRILLLCQTL